MERREFIRLGAAAPLLLAAVPSPGSPYGDLDDPDPNGLFLPPGFRSRVLARSVEAVAGTAYVWPTFPDGGATFATPDSGWIYVANSEVPGGNGGVGAIRFDTTGEIVDAYSICTGTNLNCAGGVTPWGTWITCEEFADGQAWECDPFGERDAVVRPALGRFSHEAVACDPEGRALYLTEDDAAGRLYRFTPTQWGDLADGVLEVAREDDTAISWVPADSSEGTVYAGGEGIAYYDGHVVFTTKSDQRIRDLDVQAQRVRVLHDADTEPTISGPDNVTFSDYGDLLVCEDTEAEQDLMLLAPDGTAASILRLGPDHNGSELAGVAFDPSGTRLYVSSQRGGGGAGVTYEITGPFRELAAATTTGASGSTSTIGDVVPTRPRDRSDGSDDSSPLPVVGGIAGATVVALGGLAWWRSRRGPPPA